MAKVLMIQGTASNAGKSVIVAGLLRIFKQDGYRVAPFKSQNMALNSFITPDGKEIGRAQAMQAEAAGIECDVRMNPILLKPTSENDSQVIVLGEVVGNMSAQEFYSVKDNYVNDIMSAFLSLSEENDIIVIEGAGSPAEINLNHNDFVNMGMARMANSPVFIVGDIDRGGVFASLYGTVKLIEEENRALIKGTIINKFRGTLSILSPGLKTLEDLTETKVVGVVPYFKLELDDEDSLSERFSHKKESALIDIAVIRTPFISNFTDFNALECIEEVGVRYISEACEIRNSDMLIVPGSKNTMSDLLWLRSSGMESAIKQFAAEGKPVLGICGGYQMLGKTISDPYGVEQGGEMHGLGLLDIDTVFSNQKVRGRSSGKLASLSGIFSELSGAAYSGYEIHMGNCFEDNNIINNKNVYGTYIHGIFDYGDIALIITKALLEKKGLDEREISKINIKQFKEEQYDKLADILRSSLDMDYVYKVINDGIDNT